MLFGSVRDFRVGISLCNLQLASNAFEIICAESVKRIANDQRC